MNESVEKLVAEALNLRPQARAFVAGKLIQSLGADPGEELSPAWKEEVRKRCFEMDNGLVELRDAKRFSLGHTPHSSDDGSISPTG